MAKKRTTKKKIAPKSRRTTRYSSVKLEDMTTQELQDQLRLRERRVRSLERKRDRLTEQLEEINLEIHKLGGSHAAGGRRPRNAQNLSDSLAAVLKGKQMNVTEVTAAVQEAGYITTAANFRTIVNQRLIQDKRFKKVSRGVYTAMK